MPVSAIDLMRRGGKVERRPVVALFGDEPYLRREALQIVLRATLGDDHESEDMGLTRFTGDQAELADVLDEVRTLPFLAKCRVAVVDDADGFVSAHRKELELYAEHPASTGVLVLSVKTWAATTKLAKQVEKVGLAIECKSPRESELAGWICQLARARDDVEIETDAARLLVELVGPEVALLANEVAKLAVCVGERKRIDRDDVARMVGAGRIETIWKTLEAATTGDSPSALEDLDRLVQSGEAPVGLLAAMTASLRKVHHAGRLRLERRGLTDACREAGVPTFPAAIEAVDRQHRHLGPRRVADLPRLLLEADLDLKGSSSLTPRAVLERLLVRLSLPRQD